jgi:hypothetical protein
VDQLTATTFIQALGAAANTTITAPRLALTSPSPAMPHLLSLPPIPVRGDNQEGYRKPFSVSLLTGVSVPQ